jgi:hypothetical protein
MTEQKPGDVVAVYGTPAPRIAYAIEVETPQGEWKPWSSPEAPIHTTDQAYAERVAERLASRLPTRFRVVVVENS